MAEYPYPLYFEARHLTVREKEKVRRHFQKRRDSGGGDCGGIEKVEDNIYKICFKEEEDQERVLKRKTHTIGLPGEDLHLTVIHSSSPQTQDQPSTSQSQTTTKVSTKGLEKIFKTDIFLLFYMRDNPKAYKILQKQLSAIGCTIQLDFEEEEAVVRGNIEKGPGGAFDGGAENWELQVDQTFINLIEAYTCHHVLEPKQIKKVLQDPFFASDDVKVYPESGYAVVVGESDVVKEKIAVLEKSVPIRIEEPVVEKKFKLIEEEFNREMRANCSEVKISRAANIIILEGPEDKVQSGAAKLNELIKTIKEKRVNLSNDLLDFMATSSVISKYQTRFQQSLRSPVSLEVGSELVLSSLSADALREAETAVLRDLNESSVTLQGAAAVAPDLDRLKEILNKAKNEENRGELRVNVSFLPGSSGILSTKVKLVGYTEHVNKLKELLYDYQANQVSTQEVISLQCPELVDCFDKILEIIGMKQTDVTVKASPFPNPCVLLSGPRLRVQETKQALGSTMASMTMDKLVLDGPGALQYFQGAGKDSKELVERSCQVIIREQQVVSSPVVATKQQSLSSITPRPSTPRTRFSTVGDSSVKINLEIKIGSLEKEQVNVLVVPTHSRQLSSTNIGKSLLRKGGDVVESKFDLLAANSSLNPGDVLEVGASASLGCSKIFCMECLAWDGVGGRGVQALSRGLRRCLDLCAEKGFSSVAIPVIGPGLLLKYPLSEAVQVLKESIRQFALSDRCGNLTTIHIVIKPGYPDSEESYHEVYKHLSSIMNQRGRALFGSLTSDLDDINITVGGGIKLQLVFGDITNETTDGVVNTTNFVNFYNEGVCKDILTVAGPEVEAQLKTANVSRGKAFVTPPGQFPCKAILHVCGEKDASLIETLVPSIVNYCESQGFSSVAIPAICAGAGGLAPAVVAGAILRGIKTATSSGPFYSLTSIRLVLIKINVFLAFQEEATQMFPTSGRKAPPFQVPQVQQQAPLSLIADLSIYDTIPASEKSTFLFLGLTRNDVNEAMEKLKNLYKHQCTEHTFPKEQLDSLYADDMLDLQQMVRMEGLYMKTDPSGNLIVNGMKDGVNRAIVKFNSSLHGNLRREVRGKEEDDLFARVMWCILGKNGNWDRVPKTANYNLEKKDVGGGITDAYGVLWQVDLKNLTVSAKGRKTNLKRLENLEDFIFPLEWDSMAPGEVMKRVVLESSSPEYKKVKEGFKRTATQTVMKIERVQNIHLRRAYEAQKKKIFEKNKQDGGANEKFLYHGTTEDNCDSIMKTGFNRRFCGQNATSYGEGTYFAVKASYSSHPTYSRPATDGSQLMFVARVLTGVYTLGQRDMKVPPPLDDQEPHIRYDSVVDKMDRPSMFIVFHDDQAYLDYLITFKQ
ncbi:protein mono-ADP-ribosyltransferase PARP14-like isoform X3 [Xiphophorus hellerii]|uniref:protein mono-ADP-ribosyltransferase PARP14-like isoform X3 n=1 Tax=Xiphophorus hellerii TaxID=8084 RepID=UPI0013B36982|nr:protein mono-ADP-ribosyltransferase PARP14-like isoform X3 [Xiphophorus hellerii]